MDTVLIPAYEPDEQLIQLTEKLNDAGFAVVIVNDGSGPAFSHIFDAVKDMAHILVHKKNRGKGAALKTGMAYIRDHMPESEHFITCDADGQHRVEDVARVSRQLHDGHSFVLTMRKLRKGIPLRSRVGNSMSRVVYALLTKRYLSDNQSGLRGFHRCHIDWLVQVEKDNYDYEMNVLYYASKKSIPISTLLIDAIYINNNQSSHFHPVKDTIRIYRSLFLLARGLFIGLMSAELWLAVSTLFWKNDFLLFTVPTAGVLSYAVSAIVNKYIIFRRNPCYDYLTLLIHQIIAYVLYTLGCLLCYYACPWMALWVSFNIVYLAFIPLRYWLHKFTFIAMRTREDMISHKN